MNVSFRPEYLDTIGDLCDAFYGNTDAYRVVWEVRFLARDGVWFHFYGASRNGQRVAFGHQLNFKACEARLIDPATMVFTLLDFEANPHILAYCGTERNAPDILLEIDDARSLRPEIMKLSVISHGQTLGGQDVVTATEVAFIGLTALPPEGVCRFAANRGAVSDHWYRGRRFIRPDITVLENVVQQQL